MSTTTKIEWCDHTWSPWRGCTKVSPGCANCYAERLSKRNPEVLGKWGKGKPRVLAKDWEKPVRWNRIVGNGTCNLCKSTRDASYSGNCKRCGDVDRTFTTPNVFPSLCDPFDEEVPIEWLAQFLQLIHDTPNLDWLLLTKRPESFHKRMALAVDSKTDGTGSGGDFWQWCVNWWAGDAPSNVSVGASIEDQPNADRRIPELLKIPAKVRFLSVEPMLGPIVLPWKADYRETTSTIATMPGIDWVIVGGESGPGARPCSVEWIRGVVRQCAQASVPCFVKQLGSKPEVEAPSGGWMQPYPVRHPKGGDPSEWPDDLRVRQFPEVVR